MHSAAIWQRSCFLLRSGSGIEVMDCGYCGRTLRSGTVTTPTGREWPMDEHALRGASHLLGLRAGS